MSDTKALRKALEFIQQHCANIIRTNSRDRDDWAEDMAYVGKVAADALAQPVADHVPAGPEAEADVNAALGLVLLPPIRISTQAHAFLQRIAAARGMVLQAVVREALEPGEVMGAKPVTSWEPVPLAAELALIASAADADGDDYTPALSLRAPDARIPVGLARNHSPESAWRVGWMRGWMEALVAHQLASTGVVDHIRPNLSGNAPA